MKTQKLLLTFDKEAVEKPIVYHLVKDFDLIINLYRARITAEEQGTMILDVTGSEENIKKGIAFIKGEHVMVDDAQTSFRWNESACTSCGNCLTHCPVDALHVESKETMKVVFDPVLCIDCLGCIDNCPYGACQSIFQE